MLSSATPMLARAGELALAATQAHSPDSPDSYDTAYYSPAAYYTAYDSPAAYDTAYDTVHAEAPAGGFPRFPCRVGTGGGGDVGDGCGGDGNGDGDGPAIS